MKILFLKFIVFLAVIMKVKSKKMQVFDKDVTKHKLSRIVRLTQLIHMDTEVKLKHIQKYIDMHVGTLDFELGLISGLMLNRFRLMLKLYRISSNLHYYQRYTISYYDKTFAQRLVVCTAAYLAIIVLKTEFTDAVDRYMEKHRKLRDILHKCKMDKICKTRRSMDEPELGPEDLESDYFGHSVPKVSKVSKDPDRVEQLFLLEEKSIDVPYEKLPKIPEPHDKFKKINEWLRYLANGGMAKNKLNIDINDDNDDDIYELTTDPLPTTPMMKLVTGIDKLTPHPGPPFENNEEFMGLEKEIEAMKKELNITSKKPKVPWGERGSDYEFKKKARDQYREKMRAGFDPKREGINIEMPYDY